MKLLGENQQLLIPTICKFRKDIKQQRYIVNKDNVRTVQILGFQQELNPLKPVLNFFDIRKTPIQYAQKQILWYTSMALNVEYIGKYAKMWNKVCDKDGNINSNYGFLIFNEKNYGQYYRVVNQLLQVNNSRRAVMIYNRPSIWEQYNKNGMSDFICTFATQHFIRDNKLHTIVNMRSNDFIFGFFNDFYWQCHVHNLLLDSLTDVYVCRQVYNKQPVWGLRSGDIIWCANSMHVYQQHFKMIEKIYNKLGEE